MRRELTVPARAAAILAMTLLATTACTGDADDSERSSIDAKAYYDEYETGASSDGRVYSATQEDGTADPGLEAHQAESGSDKVVPCDDCEPPRRLPPPPIGADNQFRDAGTNPALDPSNQPTSSFGLDVDTGSYRVAKHFLNKGILPPSESVRPEEWINAYDYSDQSPTGSDLGVTADSSTVSSATATQMFRVAVAARELRESDRPRASLTFVVDTSGSMDIRERLGLVKSSLALLTKSLRPDDEIAIVTYDDQARGLLEPTPVAESGKILGAIDELELGGGTNLAAGVELGYEYAGRNDDAGINAVVLASDGVANIGLTDPDGLSEKINAAADDIHLVTVGYGMGNYNDHVMEQLADQGQGFYSYVSTFGDAKQLFTEDLTSTLSVVAEDAKAQVKFDPETVQSYRLIGYENRAMSAKEFDNTSTDAGEVGPGMDVTALYEVTPTSRAQSGIEIGTATVRWTSPSGGTNKEISTPLRMPGISGEPSNDLRLASTVAQFADAVKHHQGEKGLDERLMTLQESTDALEADNVDGAPELGDLIAAAIDAHPSGGAYEIQ